MVNINDSKQTRLLTPDGFDKILLEAFQLGKLKNNLSKSDSFEFSINTDRNRN